MNRFTVDKLNSFMKGLVLLHARVLMSGTTPLLQKWGYPAINSGSLGSYSNAPTSVVGSGGIGTAQIGAEGVKSIARTGVGLWTVTLQDNYQRLLAAPWVTQSFAGGLSTIVVAGENTSITSMSASGGSVIGVALLSSTGTAADPATATSLDLVMFLQNSTAP